MEKVENTTIRRLNYLDDLVIPINKILLIIDNGCDQTIINLNSFLVQSFAGVYFTIGRTLNSMPSSKLELVNNAYTLATIPNHAKVIFKINQVFLDRDLNQTEALLQPHQARDFGVIVDDCAKRHLTISWKPGTQCLQVSNK